jgi:PAS domain S-box-containing protein
MSEQTSMPVEPKAIPAETPTSHAVLAARYKRAQEVSRVGSWEYDLKSNSFWGSDEGKRLYGLDPETEEFTAEEVMKLVVDTDRDRINCARVALLADGTPYDIVYDIIPRNSTQKRTIHSVAELERDETGHPVRVIGVLQDITKRQAIEDAYKDANKRLASIIEGTHVGTWEWNVQTGETTFNAIWAAMVGYTLEELAPITIHTWESLAHPEDLAKSGALLHQHIEGTLPYYQCESRMRHKDGHWIWVLDRGEVHHRVKNNMNTIASLLSIQAQSLKEPAAVSALQDARGRVKSMMLLYDRLFLASTSGVVSLQSYIPALIEEIVRNFSTSARIKVKTRLEDIRLDAQTLQPLGIILNELVTNVCKYAFPGQDSGTITVSASKQDDGVQIIIQDDGIGIPDYIDFDRSTGFGLQLVQALTLQLDGSIRILRDKGTKVVLEF